MCCLAHDVCYVEHFSQEACDDAFCDCLNTMAEEARGTQYATGCADVSFTFCQIVRLFGHAAHESAHKATTTPPPPVETLSTTATAWLSQRPMVSS